MSVAADAQGSGPVREWVEKAGATFRTLVDSRNELGKAFGYRAIPVGILVDAGSNVLHVKLPFSVDEAEDVRAIEALVAGESPVRDASKALEADASASEVFADGVDKLASGDREAALRRWREALGMDPLNFVIRKQIWAVENPDRFYPAIDSAWQKDVMAREKKDG